MTENTNHVNIRVTTQKVSSQLGPGTTWAQRGNMWCGSVTFRVKGKEVPRDVTSVRSLITHDEVKSGVNLKKQTKEQDGRMNEGATEDYDKKEVEFIILLYWD